MKKVVLGLAVGVLLATSGAHAQFTGPSVAGHISTVEDVQDARLGRYVTLTGNIVAHQRGDFYTFRDTTGEIRVEIERPVWSGRSIGPETRVRLLGEVDTGLAGRYIWVKSLDVLDK